jgi:alpha-1,2-mannosyltransferase
MVFHIVLPAIYTLKSLWKYQPDILYDTTGYASALLAAKFILPGITTAAYVHYPFISEDMLQKVREQRSDFNNSQAISKSPLLSKAKLYYYYLVFIAYKLIGRFVDFAQTNSSWTHEHMKKLWPRLFDSGKLTKLYPPCTVDRLLVLKKPDPSNEINIMSLAQFRPEKQQHLQL